MHATRKRPRGKPAMNNACPKCGKTYHIEPRLIGRRIPCKRCRTLLVVETDGIHAVQNGAAAEDFAFHREREESPAEILREAGFGRHRTAAISGALNEQIAADPGVWLFAAGMILLVLAFMLALIDQAAVARAQAKLNLIDLEFRQRNEGLVRSVEDARRAVLESKRILDEAQAAVKEKKTEGAEPVAQAQENYQKVLEAEQKLSKDLDHQLGLFRVERQRKAQDVLAAEQADAALNRYWYAWLALPGLIALLLGCLAFLNSASLCRKLTGTIVLTTSLIVLVLLYIVPGIRA